MDDGVRSISKSLDDGGPFIIWENGKKGDLKRGMLVDTMVCDNPECRYIHIHADAIDERFTDVTLKGGKLTYSLRRKKGQKAAPVPKQQLAASFHIDSSEVSVAADTPAQLRDPELLSWLRREIAEGLSAALVRRWRMYKEPDHDQWRRMDWGWWEEGVLVGWGDVFPDEPDFLLDVTGARYWIRDLYCVTPDCPCTDVTFSFAECADMEETRQLGSVRIDLKRFTVADIQPIGASSEDLMGLYQVFLKEGKRLKRTLKTRQKAMRAIGEEIATMSGANAQKDFKLSPKVGRNDPCPCGSGKKYKKCCLGKAVPS